MNKAMKYSGVEWLGKIPRDWEVLKAKRIFKLKNEKNSELKPLLSVNKGRGLLLREDMANRPTHAQKNIETFKLVDEGDFVIHLRSFQSGFELSSIEGAVSPAYTVFNARKNDEVCDKYYKYLFYSKPFIDKIASTTLSLRDGKPISYDEFSITLLPVPNYVEQQKIAAFLDNKVSHIDNIIEDTKKSIENLKAYKQSLITETVTKGLDPNVEMKNSGIEWVGKIPKRWMLRKIKDLTSKIGSGKTPRGGGAIYSNEGILFLRSQNIYETGLYLENATYISPEIDESMKSTRVYSNDVLLNITGGSIGRACVYPQYMETHANVNQHVCILRPIQGYIHPSYLFYYLISHVGKNYIRYYQTGGNREGLNFEQIGNFAIPSFSMHEQTEVVNYLDEKTSQVNQIVSQQEQLVKEFEFYKKSIIYEYVTGKKEVK